MIGFKSNYLCATILNYLHRGAGLTPPASLDVALYLTLPAADGTGGVEVAGGRGYSRCTITNGATMWGAPSGGEIANLSSWSFGTASADWGTLLGAALIDGSGNLWRVGLFQTPITVLSGQPFIVAAGAAKLSEA